jgi:hypothetical protein
MKSYEQRSVPQSVAVFHCDRCGGEIPAFDKPFQAPRLACGSHITGVQYGEGDELHYGGRWLTFTGPISDDDLAPGERRYAEHQAAQADLCPDCTVSLLIWFAEGKPRT